MGLSGSGLAHRGRVMGLIKSRVAHREREKDLTKQGFGLDLSGERQKIVKYQKYISQI